MGQHHINQTLTGSGPVVVWHPKKLLYHWQTWSTSSRQTRCGRCQESACQLDTRSGPHRSSQVLKGRTFCLPVFLCRSSSVLICFRIPGTSWWMGLQGGTYELSLPAPPSCSLSKLAQCLPPRILASSSHWTCGTDPNLYIPMDTCSKPFWFTCLDSLIIS